MNTYIILIDLNNGRCHVSFEDYQKLNNQQLAHANAVKHTEQKISYVKQQLTLLDEQIDELNRSEIEQQLIQQQQHRQTLTEQFAR